MSYVDTFLPAPDLLDLFDQALVDAREELARVVDRAEALAELRREALAVAARTRLPVSAETLYADRGEEERARIAALIERATGELDVMAGEPTREKAAA